MVLVGLLVVCLVGVFGCVLWVGCVGGVGSIVLNRHSTKHYKGS